MSTEGTEVTCELVMPVVMPQHNGRGKESRRVITSRQD